MPAKCDLNGDVVAADETQFPTGTFRRDGHYDSPTWPEQAGGGFCAEHREQSGRCPAGVAAGHCRAKQNPG